jgi:hypothetical protein
VRLPCSPSAQYKPVGQDEADGADSPASAEAADDDWGRPDPE